MSSQPDLSQNTLSQNMLSESKLSQPLLDETLNDDPLMQKALTQLPWAQISPLMWHQQLTKLIEQSISPQARLFWMNAMRQWHLAHPLKPVKATEHHTDQWQSCLTLMRNFAYQLCDWGLLIRLKAGLDEPSFTQSHEPLDNQQTICCLQLAVAYWQMGQLANAENFLASLNHRLDSHPIVEFYGQIQREHQLQPVQFRDISDQELQLIPLEEQHVDSFNWVYSDPQIAQLCHLPTFEHPDQWLDWLSDYLANEQQILFAVTHQDFGIIGSVFLAVYEGVGFFYYWLGQDFQGKGFGPRAVKRLLQFGQQHLGLKVCYGKVYQDNMPSLQGMKKIGFTPVPVNLKVPNGDQHYYYFGEPQPLAEQKQQLTQLIACLSFNDVLVDAQPDRATNGKLIKS